jgi:type VI secretion system secreted protein VgrG
MPITQGEREVAVITPLGEDVLLLTGMTGFEQLSQPFEYHLDLASENAAIAPADLIGQNVTVQLVLGADRNRYFNGFVSRFRQIPSQERLARYQATLVPWLWFLTRTTDCRIFQNKTAPEIVKDEIFQNKGYTDFEDGLSGSYPTLETCVQYRETDFEFVSRLLEQEGITYFFKHENGKHTLVLADSVSAHEAFPDYEDIVYHSPDSSSAGEVNSLTDLTVEQSLQPGTVMLNDFDFKNTRKDLRARANVQREHAHADFEIYDYPGDYVESADGDAYARKRIEALQAQYEIMQATTDARGLCSGYTFTLSEHPVEARNIQYLLSSVSLNIDAGEFYSTGSSGGGFGFTAQLTALDAAQPFRPLRQTVRPIIPGPQTAMVVGPSGEEIYTDEFGRVKVKFHWDRHSTGDENSSGWIRVAQVWAGKRWGALCLPRIGQEVIVEFLDGDPDRPIVTGRVYNGQAMPPYELPNNKTLSTLKSDSSKGGGGFNEIRFEDKKGEEQIFIHAQKNLDIRINNDRFETVDHNRHLTVAQDQLVKIGNNLNETVGADHKEKIAKDRHLSVDGKEAKKIGGSLSLTVQGDVNEAFKAKHSEQTTGDYYLKAQNVVIEGLQNITLSVGGSYIAIEPAGIEIKTSGQLKIQGTQVEVKGDAQTSVQGGAMTEIKGGVVKIN